MAKLFISHSTDDDAIVRALQQALGEVGQDVWIDSRELRGGDALWPEIQRAIEGAEAYVVVVSPSGLQSRWVGKELRHALEVQKQRGKDSYPVVPLSLDGTKLGVLEEFFGEEPLYIRLSSAVGGDGTAPRFMDRLYRDGPRDAGHRGGAYAIGQALYRRRRHRPSWYVACSLRSRPNSFALKWSVHAWILGWNSCVASPVVGS